MKELKFKITAILMMFAVLVCAESPYKITEHTKVIEEEFTISAGGTVGVMHKYGDVEFINSNSNTVKYEITITAYTSSESKAEEVFDNVVIDFQETSNKVIARTKRENKGKSWWDKMWNNSDEKYEVNYKVFLPQNVNIDVENRYGDTDIGDRKRDVKAEIKYGDLTIGNVEGALDLDAAYTNRRVEVGNINNLTLDISYAEIKIDAIKNGEIDSKYSEMDIGQVGQLEIDSKYDEYSIDQVDFLENNGMYDEFNISDARVVDFESKYTDIEIGLLQEKGIFDLGYGEVSIDDTSSNLKYLELDCDYTDLKFNISNTIKLDLESKYTDVKLPSTKDVMHLDKENNNYDLVATLNGDSAKANMKIDMTYGSLRIRNR